MGKKRAAKRSGNASASKRSTAVPGSYRGFSLQVNRVLFHLMRCNAGDHVCLEAFEDVGVEGAGGELLAEQTKSYLSSNPLADRSKQLWKTLSNWLDGIREQKLPGDSTRFVIFSHCKSMGTVAKSLHDAKNEADALAVVAFCKTHLNYPSGLSEDAETRQFILNILDGDGPAVSQLICRTEIELGSADGAAELTAAFKDELISEDNCDEVIKWALGWVRRSFRTVVARS